MSPVSLFFAVLAYFGLLLGVAWATSRNANNDSFFIGNKSSNWMLVAFGMVGTTLSGLTFISVPGAVGHDGFGYLQIMIGYALGYGEAAFYAVVAWQAATLAYHTVRVAWIFLVEKAVPGDRAPAG